VNLLFSFPSKTLDPHQDWMGVRAGIAETLVKMDENLEIHPWLAESWEQVDATTWKFHIREGITFHDGTPLTADTVKASFDRLLQVNEVMASNLRIASIQANDHDITFQTTEEYPAFLSELIHTNASVIKTDSDQISEKPIGTGPFQVESFAPETEIKLVSYDNYWDGAAKVDEATITFNSDGNVRALALQSGEADIVYHLPPETLKPIEDNNDLYIESITSLRAHFLVYNQTKPALQDESVRKAIDLLIDRTTVVKEIMNGHASEAAGPFNPMFAFSSDREVGKVNHDHAEELLKTAGYEKNETGFLEKDNKPLELTVATYQGRPELPLIAQYLQAEATKVGIKINLVTVENIDTYLWEKQDDWDIATYSNLTAPRGDGGFFLNSAYAPDGSLNPGEINVPQLTETIATLNTTSDPDKRITLEKQAVAFVQDSVLHSFIVHPHIIVGVHKRVKNWAPGSEEYYILTNKLEIES
jgi:peptide/nickel transport system substrate-binding protein